MNRYAKEIDEIQNQEEDKLSVENKDTSDNTKVNIEENIPEAREFNEVEEEEIVPSNSGNNSEKNSMSSSIISNYDPNSDNTQIEELRIELENSLGFEIFKKVYKIVEEHVRIYFILCIFLDRSLSG